MTIPSIAFTINQHDDHRLFFDLKDGDGNDEAYANFSEIIVSIAPSITTASTLVFRKSAGDLIADGPFAFYFDLTSALTGNLSAGNLFIEVQATYNTGLKQTIGQGQLTIVDTQIGDYN